MSPTPPTSVGLASVVVARGGGGVEDRPSPHCCPYGRGARAARRGVLPLRAHPSPLRPPMPSGPHRCRRRRRRDVAADRLIVGAPTVTAATHRGPTPIPPRPAGGARSPGSRAAVVAAVRIDLPGRPTPSPPKVASRGQAGVAAVRSRPRSAPARWGSAPRSHHHWGPPTAPSSPPWSRRVPLQGGTKHHSLFRRPAAARRRGHHGGHPTGCTLRPHRHPAHGRTPRHHPRALPVAALSSWGAIPPPRPRGAPAAAPAPQCPPTHASRPLVGTPRPGQVPNHHGERPKRARPARRPGTNGGLSAAEGVWHGRGRLVEGRR